MSKESYARGFCKAAEAAGVDPVALAKYAEAKLKTNGKTPFFPSSFPYHDTYFRDVRIPSVSLKETPKGSILRSQWGQNFFYPIVSQDEKSLDEAKTDAERRLSNIMSRPDAGGYGAWHGMSKEEMTNFLKAYISSIDSAKSMAARGAPNQAVDGAFHGAMHANTNDTHTSVSSPKR